MVNNTELHSNLHPAVLSQVKINLLKAQKYICEEKTKGTLDYYETPEKMSEFGFKEYYVDDDLEFYLPTSFKDIYVSTEGEQVVFESEVTYYYECATAINDVAQTEEFSDAVAAKKAFDCESGWKSDHIRTLVTQYSRPVTEEEIEKAINGEAVITDKVVVNPNQLSIN